MKVSSFAVASLTLLATHDGALASSSERAPSSSIRKFLPWTRAKATAPFYNPVGGAVQLGEDAKASESLDVSIPLSQSSTLGANDAPLMRDISMLTEILSDLVTHENKPLQALCQEFIDYGRQRYV